MTFDPDGAAVGGGVFGLPHGRREAAVVLLPVPFAATVTYGGGAERGPAAILAASRQVDLFDLQLGRVWEDGIFMMAADEELRALGEEARGRVLSADPDAVAFVDRAGERVNEWVGAQVVAILAEGKTPGVVGGDHSVPFGAIAAAARAHPGMGVLQVDAHMDLRRAYQGFRWSHASVMDNVLREVPEVARIVQVGVRDVCEEEVVRGRESGGRVLTWTDPDWQRRTASGASAVALCREVAAALPEEVWLSIDIDGLDPSLCPHTGTPVPGGLSFGALCLLLEEVVAAGRRVVGFDLVEVAPGPDEWDANVGARVLYKLCGFSRRSQGGAGS